MYRTVCEIVCDEQHGRSNQTLLVNLRFELAYGDLDKLMTHSSEAYELFDQAWLTSRDPASTFDIFARRRLHPLIR